MTPARRPAGAPEPRRPAPREAALWLLAACLVCFGGSTIASLGFYHDDWATLRHPFFAAGGLWDTLRSLAVNEPKAVLRPLSLLGWALPYWAFGFEPLPWHLLGWLVNAWIAFGVLRLARRYGVPDSAGLLGGILFLGFPNKDATFFWPTIANNAHSLALLIEAALAHLDWVETGRRSRLAAALAWLLACFADYDQALLMAPVLLFAPGWRGWRPPRRAAIGAGCGVALTGVYLAFKFRVLPVLAGAEFVHPVRWGFDRLAAVGADALASAAGPEVWGAALRAAGDALADAPFAALAGLALPWAALSRFKDAGRPGRVDPALYAFGAAFFFLSYAPLVPSLYRFDGLTHFNRLNNLGAFGIALASAGLIGSRAGAAPRRVAAALGGLLLAAHAGFALYWAEAWRLERQVRDAVIRELPNWPRDRTLIVRPPGYQVAGKAPVFVDRWDILSAVKVWTRDPGREADILVAGTRPAGDGLAHRGRFRPYSAVSFLDWRTERIVDGSPAALQALLSNDGAAAQRLGK